MRPLPAAVLLATLGACGHADEGVRPAADPSALDALQFEGAPPRNLLVLSVDTVQRAAFGRYSGAATTPFLDGLAADGVVLDAHGSCSSWTLPGIVCALTGARPEELGVVPHVVKGGATGALPDGTWLLPKWLTASGYSTDLYSTNTYFSAEYLGPAYDQQAVVTADAAGLVDLVLAELDAGDAATGDPWMLHLHFLDPHAPYDPPDAYLSALDGRESLAWDLGTDDGVRAFANAEATLTEAERAEALLQLRIRYEAELLYVDDQVARLWAELESRGLLDDTLVLFWTDHGEQLLEHGSIGHAGSLYAEENDAVAFWWARGLAPVAWAENTTHEDLVPTTMAALGLPVPDEASGEIVVRARTARPRFATLWPNGAAPMQSVQVGDDQLVYRWEGASALYDRGADPGQQRDVGASHPDTAASLWALLQPEVERLEPLVDVTPVDPGL